MGPHYWLGELDFHHHQGNIIQLDGSGHDFFPIHIFG